MWLKNVTLVPEERKNGLWDGCRGDPILEWEGELGKIQGADLEGVGWGLLLGDVLVLFTEPEISRREWILKIKKK